MTMYRIYNKNAGDDALAICDCYTEQGAVAEIGRLKATKGIDAVAMEFTPRCTFGKAYRETHCKNDATWFERHWNCYSAACDDHHTPGDGRVHIDEMRQIELRGESKNRRVTEYANLQQTLFK